ncbi:hypothetical protein JAAARDRAFT_61636 [Jaapia argillacea MUCL 33604]|uniref:Uncharacterized protein n=1 Tax=Jaapia argillacea MUCL 33604 TaxID=933084 RepID=A0A067PR88_9AGAM|nr:hypothetical protein JAAARDRAFT_61636 [Jaapia argillacea MUCL 33604]
MKIARLGLQTLCRRRTETSFSVLALRLTQLRRSLASGTGQNVHRKLLSTTSTASTTTSVSESTTTTTSTPWVYRAPLAGTFRRLKIFSLSSLTLSFALSPFIFIIDSSLPLAARFILAATAVGTSGLSTALVSWVGRPYVAELQRFNLDGGVSKPGGTSGVEMTTYTLGLHKRLTRVYDTTFLVDTKRPFAKWELAESVELPLSELSEHGVEVGSEETVAEVLDKSGEIVGRWIVQWHLAKEDNEKAVGKCRGIGQVVRHFNVHEELLDRPLR